MPSSSRKGQLFYCLVPDEWSKAEKLEFLANLSASDNSILTASAAGGRRQAAGGRRHYDPALTTVSLEKLFPNREHTWLRSETEDEFDSFLPIGSKEAKRANPDQAETLFYIYTPGITTARDMWVFDYQYDELTARVKKTIFSYNRQVDSWHHMSPKPNVDDFVGGDGVKWSRDLKLDLMRRNYARFKSSKIRESLYRPFTRKYLFFDRILNEEIRRYPYIFPDYNSSQENCVICFSGVGHDYFRTLIGNNICEMKFSNSSNGGTQCFPFYTYDADGSNRRENITDFALEQFRRHYADSAISKWQIFEYVYGMLHHPGYRERYALDLKRSLPRIPFAPVCSNTMQNQLDIGDKSPSLILGEGFRVGGFQAFSRAGKQLADLHLNYESIDRYELDWQATRQPQDYRVEKMLPKGKVAAAAGDYKVYSALKYNESLTLHGIPERAFAYRLGNRSALDWVVDQYRVKTDKRSGIKHDPNGYSDDPQYILKLIERVITVSLRTVDIVQQLAQLPFRAESAGA